MKLPRDCDAKNLIRALIRFGYRVSRQTGSHVRLTTSISGVHHVTVPNHRPIRVGTLQTILGDIAAHHRLSVPSLLEKLEI